jgi:hypothetical protein
MTDMVSEFTALMHEHMDLSDRDTRRTIIGLDEADQNQLLAALTSKLYDKIVEKVDDIDFGTIPRSRGDITKIENYASIMECIDILRSIIIEYKEDTYPIDVVSTAVENIKQRTKTFTKAYALNVELPIVLYNTICLAIVSSVSYLISGCIEYIKDPGAETYTIALNKVGYQKTAQNLLFENLAAFNDACKKGDIDVALTDVIRNNHKLSESAEDGSSTLVINIKGGDTDEDEYGREAINDSRRALSEDVLNPIAFTTRALLGLCKLIIPLLQNLVYYFYQTRQNISDYFAIQSELLQMNAYKVQYSTTMADDQRKAVYSKQMKIADKLRKVSNAFSIDYNRSKKSAADLAAEEKKKFTSEELGMPTPLPTSGQSSLF